METFINRVLCVQFQLIKIQLKCRAVLLFRLNFTTHTHWLGFSFIDSFQQKRQHHRNQFLSLLRSRDKYRQHSINYYCVCVRRRRRRIQISTENPLTTKGYPNQIWWVLGMTVLLPSTAAAAECIDRLILINCSLEIRDFHLLVFRSFFESWPMTNTFTWHFVAATTCSTFSIIVPKFFYDCPWIFHFQFHHDKELSRSKAVLRPSTNCILCVHCAFANTIVTTTAVQIEFISINASISNTCWSQHRIHCRGIFYNWNFD